MSRTGVEQVPPVSQHARTGRRQAWLRRAPLLPALIFMIALTQVPFLASLVISTYHWNSLLPDETKFVGFDNYVTVFTDTDLRSAVIDRKSVV